jgi:hypothetical protein
MCTARPDSKHQEYPAQSFLWVNKDYSSTSVRRNTKEEKRTIYRHVQRNHSRRQQAEKDAFISNRQAKSLVGWGFTGRKISFYIILVLSGTFTSH